MANLKRNRIELVTGVNGEEVVTKNYLTPVFIPFGVVYEAMDLKDEIEESSKEEEPGKEKVLMDKMVNFIAEKVYNKQFTKEDLINGLHAPNAMQELQEQLAFVANGQQTDATKKFLEKKN
ncbi:hypothetical protein [Sutcliffiella sp. FSL R7-0096]|uniref:phage tail assembly chaperone G n=1 Tax=Sutcliffiella sp. FSL R7-0096 TaxID=2921670 RepID=UPI00315A6DAC